MAFRFGSTPESFPCQPRFVLKGYQADAKSPVVEIDVDVCSFERNGRWNVLPRGATEPLTVSASKIRVDDCSRATPLQRRVRVRGVESRPELNGQVGVCGTFRADRGRWPVRLGSEGVGRSATPLLLKSSCLCDEDSGNSLVDPIDIGMKEIRGVQHRTLTAASSFFPGDVIFREKPAVIVPEQEDAIDDGGKHAYETILQAIGQFLALPTDQRSEVLDLYAHDRFSLSVRKVLNAKMKGGYKSHEKQRDINRVDFFENLKKCGFSLKSEKEADDVWRFVGIWEANSYTVNESQGLFLKLSRANHSCVPNVLRAELSSDEFAVVAVTPISPGDEILCSYLIDWHLMEPTERRRQRLLHWRFLCECSRCSNHGEEMRGTVCTETLDCKGMHPTNNGVSGPCNVCGGQLSAQKKDLAKKVELELAELYRSIEENPASVSRDGGKLLCSSIKRAEEFFPESHWLVEAFHDISRDFRMYTGDIRGAKLDLLAVLRFLDTHLKRPSVRRGLLRIKLGQTELRLGERFAALQAFSAALGELGTILPPDHDHCKGARDGLTACFEE